MKRGGGGGVGTILGLSIGYLTGTALFTVVDCSVGWKDKLKHSAMVLTVSGVAISFVGYLFKS